MILQITIEYVIVLCYTRICACELDNTPWSCGKRSSLGVIVVTNFLDLSTISVYAMSYNLHCKEPVLYPFIDVPSMWDEMSASLYASYLTVQPPQWRAMYFPHYGDVIIGAMASQSPAARFFVTKQIKEIIKAPPHWPLCGEFAADRWIPCTRDQ